MDPTPTLYLTITRGAEPRPIVATSDPGVLRAVARALYEALQGPGQGPDRRVLRLAQQLEPDLPAGESPEGGQ